MTALIKVTLTPGLWGETTAKHSAEFIREKTRLSHCNTTLITVDNTHINILAKGRTREVEALAKKVKNSVITIESVEVES